jgi:hypothetical protein
MNAAMLARGWTAAGLWQHRAPLHNKASPIRSPMVQTGDKNS